MSIYTRISNPNSFEFTGTIENDDSSLFEDESHFMATLTHPESLYSYPQTNIEDKGIEMEFIPPPPPMPPLSSMPLSSMPMQMPMSMDGYPLYPVHTPPTFQSIPMSMPMPVRETRSISTDLKTYTHNSKYVHIPILPVSPNEMDLSMIDYGGSSCTDISQHSQGSLTSPRSMSMHMAMPPNTTPMAMALDNHCLSLSQFDPAFMDMPLFSEFDANPNSNTPPIYLSHLFLGQSPCLWFYFLRVRFETQLMSF